MICGVLVDLVSRAASWRHQEENLKFYRKIFKLAIEEEEEEMGTRKIHEIFDGARRFQKLNEAENGDAWKMAVSQ